MSHYRIGDTVEVKLGVVNIANASGWIIDSDVMQDAIDRRFSSKESSVLGTLCSVFRGVLFLSDISHIVVSAAVKGDCVTGMIRLIDTEYGRRLLGMVNKRDVRFAPLGHGSIVADHACMGYELICFNAIDRDVSKLAAAGQIIEPNHGQGDHVDHTGEMFNSYTGRWTFL